MIVETQGLVKTYSGKRAVDNLSFTLDPGTVTGFLGPNGSGKSTTLRLMLGLDHGEGSTTWDGKSLTEYPHATQVVGAHLDAKFFNPNRTARNHLRMLGAESGISNQRVDEVIDLVGLTEVAKKRPKSFSLGMGQRLGLAGALLSEPKVLLLDEPANGLDPQSILWLRDFLKYYASLGNVVFVSSHLLSEMQTMADHLVVISRGALIADQSMAQFVARSAQNDVLIRVADPAKLMAALEDKGFAATSEGDGGIAVHGVTTDQLGALAFGAGVQVNELRARTASLEQAFMELTSEGQEYGVGGGGQPGGQVPGSAAPSDGSAS
ncbi:MAG: ATP-binding cassette domain-containing protein [Candidatus Nanopelagicales bacterium]